MLEGIVREGAFRVFRVKLGQLRNSKYYIETNHFTSFVVSKISLKFVKHSDTIILLYHIFT